jgi:RHS repeat-associated protein
MTYGYDTFGDQTQVQDPDGNVTTTAYDGDGRTISTEQAAYTPPGASASVTQPTTYSYDEDGNLVSKTDPAGNATSYTYDALGDVTSVTEPELPGQSRAGTYTYTYDADGEQLSATDPLGNESHETYAYFGSETTSTDALGNTTQYAYDYLGDQTAQVLPSGSSTTSVYDGLGELTSQTDGAGDTSSESYNGLGEVASVTAPDGTSEQYSYDGAGNQVAAADVSAPAAAGGPGTVLRAEYAGFDGDGDQVSSTDWDGNTTTDAHNAADELTSQVVPVSSSSSITTSYGYDAAGNRTSVTDGDGNTTWTTFNSWDLPESVVEPVIAAAPDSGDRTWTTGYDADGRPSAVAEPGGVSLSYGYDPLGDITSESGSGASASTPGQSFTYDLDGRMASASAPGGADGFTYNGDSDLESTSGPSGTSSYQYNSDGLVSSETDAAGTTGYTYDDADRLATESDPLTGSTLTYGYNADGNPASVSYTGSDGSAGPVETLGYDGLERLASDTLTSASGSVLASEDYGYDSDGNVTSQATGGLLPASSETFGYDEADRLVSATANGSTVTYGYDNDGNLTADGSGTSSYNAQDQLTSSTDGSGTTSYAYALNGDLSSVTPPSRSAQDYAFDAYGNLASAGGVSYAYDALGRLVTRTTGSTTTSMSYLGSGDTVASDGTDLYSYDPLGAVTAEGGAAGSGDAVMTDQHGDVTAAFSPDAGTTSLEGTASYGPWGDVTGTTGSMPGLGYQSDYTDPTTGLVEMGARWYSPATGSFVSSDTTNGTPIPSTVDGNPYAYANGNPLTETDPTGHFVPCGNVCSVIGETAGATGEGFDEGSEEGEGCGPLCMLGGGLIEGVLTGAAEIYDLQQSSTAAKQRRIEQWSAAYSSMDVGPTTVWNPDNGASLSPTTAALDDPESPNGNPDDYLIDDASLDGPTEGPCGFYACPPPPPPPPPQDIYAEGAKIQKASKALLHTKVITKTVHDNTNAKKLLSSSNSVKQTAKASKTTVKGTTGDNSNTSASNTGDIGQDVQKLIQTSTQSQGVPSLPSATGGGNTGGGSQAGSSSCVPYNGSESAGEGYDPEFPSIKLSNYRGRFNAALNKAGMQRLPADWDAHHAIPQEYRDNPELCDFDFDSPSNMRRVPGSRMQSRLANVHQDNHESMEMVQ